MNGRGREAAHKAVNQIFTIDGGFSPKKKSRTGTWISASLRGAGRNVIGGSVPMTSNRVQVVAHPDIGKPAGVLIVEDETLIASFIDAVLGIAGFRVVGIAGSGPEALVLAAETRPALALIDIRLNGPLDGAELACLLRDRLAVPAIFLAGLVDREILQRANAARPLGFVAKPFSPSQVFNAIDRALRPTTTLPQAR